MKPYRTPMPSPRGTNKSRLYLTNGQGFAYDAASAPKTRMSKQMFDRMYDHLAENYGKKAADAVWSGMTGPAYERDEQEQAKDVEADPNPQLRKGSGKGGYVDGQWYDDVSDLEHGDALPTYKSNGTPRNAIAGDSNPLAGIVLPKRGYP